MRKTTREDLGELTAKTLTIREELLAVIVGRESEPAYAALVEVLSILLLQADIPILALGHANVLLVNYLRKKGALPLIEVQVSPEEDDEDVRLQPTN